jgi:hypothetical protein
VDEHYLKRELYELVEGSRVFDFLQRGALDGVWYWDLDNPEHEWMSPEFWRTFGYDPTERRHLASEWQDLIHPDDLQTAMRNLEAHKADPSHPYDQDVRYRHADGSWVWVRCRGIIVRDDDGTPRRMLGVHQDITALKRAQEAAVQVESLRASNERLARFAYTVSHDLKAPLRGIRTCVDWLETDLGDRLTPDLRETLDFLRSRSDRLTSLVRGVLDYSRATVSDRRVPLALADLVRDGVAAADAGGQLSLELPADLPSVQADPAAMSQLFCNILRNAAENGATRIQVSAASVGRMVRIALADDGPGIAMANRERVFDLFTTLRSRDDRESTGIGLATCRAIVEAHGGRIHMADSPLDGVAVVFTLPTPG